MPSKTRRTTIFAPVFSWLRAGRFGLLTLLFGLMCLIMGYFNPFLPVKAQAAAPNYALKFFDLPASIPVGQESGPFVLKFTDSNGIVVQNTAGTLNITLRTSSSGGGFSSSAGGAYSATKVVQISANGNTSDPFYYKDTQVGNITLTGESGNADVANGVATVQITPGPPAKLKFSVHPAAYAIPGLPLIPAPAVALYDSADNPVSTSGVDITLALAGGANGAVLSGTKTRSTVNGVATFPDLAVDLSSATPYQLVASAQSLTAATSNNFLVQPGKLVFSVQPGNSSAGQQLSTQPQVTVHDGGDALYPVSNLAISLSLSGGAAGANLTGNTGATTQNGIASFSGLAINKGSSTPYQLLATGGTLTSATSTPFTVDCTAGSLIVNSLDDGPGDNCNVTLRQALATANATQGGAVVSLSGLTPTGGDILPTIRLNSALPDLAAGVKLIADCKISTGTGRGKPTVALDGTNAGNGISGLTLKMGTSTATGNTIQGLALINFKGYGLVINGATGNKLSCNYIGTDDGSRSRPNLLGGTLISGNAGQATANVANSFGLPGDPASGNLISGNGGPGVQISGLGARNLFYYNYIGYSADGTTRLKNNGPAVKLTNQARLNLKSGNKLT